MTEKVVYNDPTPNNFPADYDDSQVDSRVKIRSKSIAHKDYGVHVREALMQGIEISSVVANEAKNIANDTASRQDNVEDRYDNQIAGNTDINEVIDARKPTNKPSYSTLGERLDNMPSNEDVPNIKIGDAIKIGAKVSTDNQTKIDELKKNINHDLFNFVFFTDSHYDQWNDPNRTGLDRLNNALLMDGMVDAIIAGGDNVDGGSSLYDIVLSQHKEYIEDMFFYHNEGSDKFILKGNHDDASGRQISYRKSGDKEFANTTSIPSEDLKRIYNNTALLNGEKRNGNSNYFYKDYPDKKIRLVGLDSNDTPDTILNSDGFLKYPGLMYMGYRQTQIDWLANTALQNVPEDYTTVIVGHVHAHARTGANVQEDDIYNDHYYNIDLVDQVINDFMRGTSSTLTSTTKDWEVSVKADFTNQGKRIMAAFIHGHQHQDNYTSDLGFNNIGITSSIGSYINNPSGDGWAVISVDPTKQTIQVRGFGRAETRSFNFING